MDLFFYYLIGLHFLPHFDLDVQTKNKKKQSGSQTFCTTLYHIIPNSLRGVNMPKHQQGIIIIEH